MQVNGKQKRIRQKHLERNFSSSAFSRETQINSVLFIRSICKIPTRPFQSNSNRLFFLKNNLLFQLNNNSTKKKYLQISMYSSFSW